MIDEGTGYVVQPAPPSGIHITITKPYGDQLRAASDAVAAGVNIDNVLRDKNVDTTCPDLGTRYYGDKCAFRVLRSFEVQGWLAVVGNVYWNDATDWDEFDDFRNDGMARIRAVTSRCLHVTSRNYGDWPIEWQDSNWTYRDASDPNC